MGRIIFASGFGGWLAIVAIAYRLADKRIPVCRMADTYTAEANCTVRAMAVRDSILTGGLAVALFIVIAAMIAFAITARRGSTPFSRKFGWSPANRGNPALPR